eukprot:s835_g7.t1
MAGHPSARLHDAAGGCGGALLRLRRAAGGCLGRLRRQVVHVPFCVFTVILFDFARASSTSDFAIFLLLVSTLISSGPSVLQFYGPGLCSDYLSSSLSIPSTSSQIVLVSVPIQASSHRNVASRRQAP